MKNEMSLDKYGVVELKSAESRDIGGSHIYWWAATMTIIAMHDAIDELYAGWNRAHKSAGPSFQELK